MYPDERLKIEYDSRQFLDNLPEEGVIIDKIQCLPSLLSYMQGYVDEKKRMVYLF